MALKSNKGFVYKPRDKGTMKERANRKGARFDQIFKQGFDSFTPKQGDNLIRYLPPTWDDADHYGYTIYVHSNIGPDNSQYLCLYKMKGKACPCCEASKEAKDAGEAEEARALNWSERIVSWILDREGDDPEKPVLYSQSWTQDRDVTALCVNDRTGEILMIDHPDNGYDVAFKRTGTGLKTKYYGWQVERSDSPIHDKQKVQDEILDYIRDNPVPDALNFYDYDYIKGVLSGKVEAKDEEVEGNEEPPFETETKPTGRRRAEPVEEEEVEEPDDETPSRPHGRAAPRHDVEENEEEDAPPPRASSRARKPEPEDEEEPAPKTTVRRRVVEEVVEEEEEEVIPRRRTVRK